MPNKLPPSCVLLALTLLYAGERVFDGKMRTGLNRVGMATLGVGLLLALVRIMRNTGDRRKAWAEVFFDYLVVFVGLSLYATQRSGIVSSGRLFTLLQVCWPGVLLLGLLPAIAQEMAM